jgi:hypothetical protein
MWSALHGHGVWDIKIKGVVYAIRITCNKWKTCKYSKQSLKLVYLIELKLINVDNFVFLYKKERIIFLANKRNN